jgi:hypothetical protein
MDRAGLLSGLNNSESAVAMCATEGQTNRHATTRPFFFSYARAQTRGKRGKGLEPEQKRRKERSTAIVIRFKSHYCKISFAKWFRPCHGLPCPCRILH